MQIIKQMKDCLALMMLLVMCGCATSYTLPNGDKRVIGFVSITIPVAKGDKAGTAFRTQNIGLMLYNHPDQKGLSIGYSDMSIMQLENNACVINLDLSSH